MAFSKDLIKGVFTYAETSLKRLAHQFSITFEVSGGSSELGPTDIPFIYNVISMTDTILINKNKDLLWIGRNKDIEPIKIGFDIKDRKMYITNKLGKIRDDISFGENFWKEFAKFAEDYLKK